MNLMTVCLAAGAISFARCELGFPDQKTPPQGRHRDRPHADGPDAVVDDGTEEPPGNSYPVKDFRLLERIYDECKTKVNRRLKKFIKTDAPSESKAYFWSLWQCVKVYGFRALDRTLQEDVIPVTEYACFIKDGRNGTEGPSGRSGPEGVLLPMKDYAPRVLSRGWSALLQDRIDALLRTHSLKFRTDDTFVSRGRSRRRDHRMFAMMVMGFMIMASILIPMGFQFLTVLGGKSLLLAKMALIMSAINGLKKIATSNVGYGFYHTGAEGHHHDHPHHGFHEKHLQLHAQNYNPMQGYN